MNHLYNTKPHFQTIVDKQRLAEYRLNKDTTSRTAPERANYERTLQPIPLSDVELPKLPLVRLKNHDEHWVLIGEMAQTPGRVILLSMNGTIELGYTADQLELVSPIDLS